MFIFLYVHQLHFLFKWLPLRSFLVAGSQIFSRFFISQRLHLPIEGLSSWIISPPILCLANNRWHQTIADLLLRLFNKSHSCFSRVATNRRLTFHHKTTDRYKYRVKISESTRRNTKQSCSFRAAEHNAAPLKGTRAGDATCIMEISVAVFTSSSRLTKRALCLSASCLSSVRRKNRLAHSGILSQEIMRPFRY